MSKNPSSVTAMQLQRYRHAAASTAGWVIVALLAVSFVLLGQKTTGTTAAPAELTPEVARAVLVVVAAGLAIALLVVFIRASTGARADELTTTQVGALTASLLFACAIGPLSVTGAINRHTALAAIIGCANAAVLGMLALVIGRSSVWRNALWLIIGTSLCGALAWGVVLFIGWPDLAVLVLMAGVAPLMLQALPSLSITVPDHLLLEYEELMRVRWTVRGHIPGGAQPLSESEVAPLVRRAQVQLLMGTIIFSALPVLTLPAIFAQAADDPLTTSAVVVFAFTFIATLLLLPRQRRGTAQRAIARLAALAILAVFVWEWALPRFTESTVLVLALIIAGCGLVVAALIAPIGHGHRSLALSRLADGVQQLSIALSLPAAMMAGGYVELVRGLAS